MSAKKKNSFIGFASRSLLSTAVVLASIGQSGVVSAEEGFFEGWEVGGYVRQYLSFNLENPYLGDPSQPMTSASMGNYRYDLSMARTVGRLNLYKDMGSSQFYVSARVSREYETNYMKDLQKAMDQWAQTGGASKSGIDLMDDVYNEADIRELWWQTDIRPSTTLKLGKQQVVWGESDFFQSMDVIHGYDFRWRSFLEVENEELRKPLWMANLVQRFDNLDGSLQLIYIPGRMNAADQRGNNYDVEGGRWANNPNKGVTFESAPFGANVPYNYDHKAANADDAAYGIRWSGLYGPWGYSLGWFRGPAQVPVINPNPLTNGNGLNGDIFFGPYKGQYASDPNNSTGELIFPQIDVFGVTANRYLESIDAVFSTELSYIPDNPYNAGVAALEAGGCGFFPGFCGIIEKDVVKSMFRLDKQVNLQSLIGTSRPSFLSVQLFDTWITNYKRDDGVVNLAGFSGRTKEHSTILTGILAMNYANDKVNPTLALGTDLTYGGGFVIPSVEYAYGNHWRFKAEADIFFDRRSQKAALHGFNDTNLFGYFAGNDQLVFRITYQF